MASVTLDGVSKRYPNGHQAVRELTLEIASGELLVLVGPSGCGKSTLLRLIAGLEAPTSGRIFIDGRDVTADPPQQRDLAMVFQSYALYPHKTVYENLAFGLRVRGIAAAEVDARVRAAAATLRIEPWLDRRPAQLSGGQRQRVAVGRAIVREPRAFLLDEPLSNLDPLLRTSTRAELALLQRRLGATMVYVTHDQEEALTLGTRIAVMRDGGVEQLAPPGELFERPQTMFVGQFVGAPAMNLWPARLKPAPGGCRLTTADFTVDVPTDVPLDLQSDARNDVRNGHRHELRNHADAGDSAAAAPDVMLGIRPHDIEVVDESLADGGGVAEVVESLGAAAVVHVRTAGRPDELIRVLVPAATHVKLGEPVHLRLRRNRVHLYDPASERRLAT